MPKSKSVTPKTTSVESLKHHDKRANIPTEELRDFVADDEKTPKTVLYPRDPSLDPQLVWKGKAEQDASDLAVPAVPVYIQEKIQPRAIIENVRSSSPARGGGQGGGQLSLLSDFNGIEFEDLIDFYRHEQNWANRMILGDSLLVMTSLAEKEGLKGQVQMIYLDPPYGIKFGSNWQVSTRKRDVKDGKADDTTRQPEQIKAFRDTWELGIHSYLAYLRDRLTVARELLTESGSVFVQIGDENVHLVRCVMDEIFGSENFVSQITFRKKLMPLGAKTLESMADYLLWYAKNAEGIKYRQLYAESQPDPSARWTGLELLDGTRRMLTQSERSNFSAIPEGARVFSTVSQAAPSFSATGVYDWIFEGVTYVPPKGQCWVTSADKMNRLAWCQRVVVEGGMPRYLMYHNDFPLKKITNPWTDTAPAQDKSYVV
jgi:adenine-specific DNA-methyltransferase